MNANRPRDLPPPSHWATRPHGTRLRYIAGCRCVPCRAANSRYETMRRRCRAKRQWNGPVIATRAVEHVRSLSAQGMGYKAVARIARVSKTKIQRLLSGRAVKMRALAVERICAVPLRLEPHALIDARPTWRLLDQLIADGYPKLRLARFLGQRGPGLQIGRLQVTVKTAERVAKLHAFLLAAEPPAARPAAEVRA